ncbi:hypothetical protein DY000_02053028 [Brassica cretica]|uniref:Uncharacterized protein n=2 Tax=Brassica cretica TaxID=69181 RepID=A0ABQ7AHN6_BRACR|nr:hypothetical protein DY000_02053028 [Brassica cretica]
MSPQVRWPDKMKAPNSFLNPNWWCDFHSDHNHKMEDCVALKMVVNELLKKGHFWVSEVNGIIQVAAKKSTRNAKNGLEFRRSNRLLLETDEIIFTAKKQEKVISPHHHPLFISLTVANCLVKLILVDIGSSTNIVFLTAFNDMGLEEDSLTRNITPIVGSSGEPPDHQVSDLLHYADDIQSHAVVSNDEEKMSINAGRFYLQIVRSSFAESTVDRKTSQVVDRQLSARSGLLVHDMKLKCRPKSTRSNKEKSLLFSDPALLKRPIHKERRATSIDNNTTLSTDFCELPPIDTCTRISIDTDPRVNMVTTLVMFQDVNGDLHDLDGHMRNAAGQRLDDQEAVIPDHDITNQQKVSIDEPIRISIDTPFAPSIDYSIMISIDVLLVKLYARVECMLTKLTRSALALLIARNLAQLECFQDENEALACIYQS